MRSAPLAPAVPGASPFECREGRVHGLLALAVAMAAATPPPAAAQSGFAPDAFEDSVAKQLYTAAHANWKSLDESVLRYTAVIRQRAAVTIRALWRDRVIYHNETAVRAFWERENMPVVQVLGTRSEYPGREIAIREGDLNWLEDMPFDRPFEPGGEVLLGFPDQDDPATEPGDDYWLAHPLAEGADSLYRFRSGDTLTLSFPDGRRLRAIQLDVLAREADSHRISGSLWIEHDSGALVRAVYRLSREFDAMRDIDELREEEERGTFRFVPGLFKPWTFDLSVASVDYSLWDFKAWLPHSMRLEGQVAAGIIKFPVSMDVSYDIESVTLAEAEEADPEGGAGAMPPPSPPLKEVHFETRAEAMAFIARLLSEDESLTYEALEANEPGLVNSSWMIAPEERHLVAETPHIPPPIWKDAPGFPSDADLEEFIDKLEDLPAPSVAQAALGFHWGWARHDLIRYNRVEGPAIGGSLDWALGRRFSLDASGFFGLADLRPKVRLGLERSTALRRLSLGAFHELRPTDPAGRHLDFGNSLNAFLFGRDDGEYYRTTGADLAWRPPDGARPWYALRAYAERQSAVENQIDFALFRAFDGDGTFRPNIEADRVDEAGAEVRLSPWWGHEPGGVQMGAEVEGRWAVWRVPGEELRTAYQQAGATVRAIVPVSGGAWRRWNLGFEAGAGTTWGEAPVQRSWFLGGAGSLRGYSAAVLSGPSFARGRVELSRTFEAGSAIIFGDAGWAGDRDDIDSEDVLYGIGLGGSILDGLIRLDLSHGLKGPQRRFRVDLYLDAIL